ncbi:MAG: beta-N-acetylglucosaminidase domain-containing protein [Verrucomicrobiota bacterium]|nr:beta-N-acetylglucosaminidase domain-containing protein [Verrucomicrobiota bacterium]
MMGRAEQSFLKGVIEGFYGRPWSQSQRLEMLERMQQLGLNTYLYCPKDDLKHRALWRDEYTADELQRLRELIEACGDRGVDFFYGIAPGLTIRYSDPDETERLRARIQQLTGAGCRSFAILFDDIPDEMAEADRAAFGSLAKAQCETANSLYSEHLAKQDGRLIFCPTPYCQRMADDGHGGAGYLEEVGQRLANGIDIFWTGPEIISREITTEGIGVLRQKLQRKPVLWDNLHANDYDMTRIFLGPYSGRPIELRDEVGGILLNPNCEFEANFVALKTLAAFLAATGSWDSRSAYESALAKWLPRFSTVGGDGVSLDDLMLLGDAYYLPHENGELAEQLYDDVRAIVGESPGDWGEREDRLRERIRQVVELARKLTELRQRELFYALNRQVWELREELELIEQFMDWKKAGGDTAANPFRSGNYLPGTYRGGLVRRLQQLISFGADGILIPANE